MKLDASQICFDGVDHNNQTEEEFLAAVEKDFVVEKKDERYHPEAKYTYGMYVAGSWYKLSAKEGSGNDRRRYL